MVIEAVNLPPIGGQGIGFVMTPYGKMQESLASAAREQGRQKRKAASIMDKLAAECVSKLGIPAENIKFSIRQRPEDVSNVDEPRGYPSSEFVIARDNEGRWTANMEIQVDPGPEIHIYTTTIVQLEVFFRGATSRGELSVQGEDAGVELTDTSADVASIAGIVDQVATRIFETSQWVESGIGKKPSMGFDSIRLK